MDIHNLLKLSMEVKISIYIKKNLIVLKNNKLNLEDLKGNGLQVKPGLYSIPSRSPIFS